MCGSVALPFARCTVCSGKLRSLPQWLLVRRPGRRSFARCSGAPMSRLRSCAPMRRGLITTGLAHLHGYRPPSANSGDRHIGSGACVGSRMCPTATGLLRQHRQGPPPRRFTSGPQRPQQSAPRGAAHGHKGHLSGTWVLLRPARSQLCVAVERTCLNAASKPRRADKQRIAYVRSPSGGLGCRTTDARTH